MANTYKRHNLPNAVKERLEDMPSPAAPGQRKEPFGKEWAPAKRKVDVHGGTRVQKDSENCLSRESKAEKTFDYDRVNNHGALKDGYLLRKQPADQENYTGQYNPDFYETITDEDGVEGMLYRANFLDRI